MLPLLLAAALAVPFLHHRHHAHSNHATLRPVSPVAAAPKAAMPPATQLPLVKLADPVQQELEQTQN